MLRRPFLQSLILTAPALLASLPALLASAPALAQSLAVQAAVEAEEDGYIVSAGVRGDFVERTSWDLAAAHADTDRDLSGVATTSYDVGVSHDFGKVGIRVGLGGWEDADLVTTSKVAASLDFHGKTWSVALQSELRDSDFDPIEVNRTIVRRDGTTLRIAARADCAMDDVGLGARLRFSNDAWSWQLHGMSYDYDDPECGFDTPALAALRSATRGEFVQLADRVAAVLSQSAGTRLLAETSFLDSRIGTSLSYTSVRRYTVQYDHFDEAFFGTSTDTVSGGAAFAVGEKYELEVYAGVTASDAFSNVAFLGFSMLFAR